MAGRSARRRIGKSRRAEIQQLFEKYDLGTFPPKPKLDRVVALDETHGNGYLIRNVRLEFGPGSRGTMRVQLMIPDGKGPFPVLISPNLAGWGPSLLRRGYISCGYAANDAMDDAAALGQLYPDYDFALLPRRAWAAGPVLDYLESLPQVDMKHVAMFGYSRDGKMAAMAAALHERISAVIAGSTGVGGVLAWRAAGERGFGESIESATRSFPTWFVPRLRFFAGREDRLPIDGNLLAALIAPRAALLEWGHNDQVSNTWGMEQTYYSALKVYKLLGQPNRLGYAARSRFPRRQRSGGMPRLARHPVRPLPSPMVQQFDLPMGLGQMARQLQRDSRPEKLSAARRERYSLRCRSSNYDDRRLGIEGRRDPKVCRMGFGRRACHDASWPRSRPGRGGPPVAGSGGAAGGRPAGNPGQTTPDLVAWVISNGGTSYGWKAPEKDATVSKPIAFGFNVRGDLYYPANTPEGTKLPTVIWLHGFSCSLGYMWVYHSDLHPILALVRAGYAVLAYDQTGNGSRQMETGPFYDRYPHWSQMGRMVEDARAAVDALSKDSLVDSSRIYAFGYSIGATAGLYAAALDPRIKGIVSISGFTPMRTDAAERGDGGIARYSSERPLMPRLGFFIGHERQIPYDFDEVIGAIAPRPLLVVQPALDRDANPADVHSAVDEARKVYALYGAADKLELSEPWDYNRLPEKTQDEIIRWMHGKFQ